MADTKWAKFLDKWDDDDEIRRVLMNHLDTLKGARDDDERIEIALGLLRSEMQGWDKKKYDELWREWGESLDDAGFLYTPSNIASELGFTDRTTGKDEKVSGLDEFRKKYWKLDGERRALWKDTFERKHGKGSWENVKRVMRGDLHEQELRSVEKARGDIMEGSGGAGEWLASALLGLTAPRSKDAFKQGRNPGAAEVIGDVLENAAYAAMPVGAIGGAISKGAGRVLNRTAGKLLGGALAEFTAPAAVELADAALGNTDPELEDILIGGFTNLGVNKGLGRMAGLTLGTLGKKVRSGGVPKPIRDRLEGVKSSRERADELVSDSRRIMDAASVSDAEAYRNITRNTADLPGVAEQQEAINILRTAENADRKKASEALDDLRGRASGLDEEIAAQKAELRDLEERATGIGIMQETGSADLPDETLNGLKGLLDEQSGKVSQEIERLGNERKLVSERIGQLEKAVKADDILSALDDRLSLDQLYNRVGIKSGDNFLLRPVESPLKKLEGDLGIPAGTLVRHPELLSLFGKELKPTGRERALEAALQWGVNRAGTDSDAQVLSTLTQGAVDPKKLREGQYERREERKDSRAARVLDTDGYTGEDLKYLKMISEKPSVLTYGLKDEKENNAFRNWLLIRGNEILLEQDSPLARRTFSIQ